MSTVYKYCGLHGLDILRNCELKITPPNEFNDPFEFTPHIICSNLRRSAKQLVNEKDGIREIYESAKQDGHFRGNFRQFRELHRSHRAELIRLATAAIPRTLAELQRSLLGQISSRFGVLCLSQRRDSLLMWGHYCASHQGIVIGFDDSNEIFKQGPGLRPVNYVRARVQIDIKTGDGGAEWFKHRDELVFSKNDDWAYERELRQLFMLDSLKERTFKTGVVGHFCPIPASAIVSVTMGTKCLPEVNRQICSIIGKPDFSHVKVDRAELQDSQFALKFVACD